MYRDLYFLKYNPFYAYTTLTTTRMSCRI